MSHSTISSWRSGRQRPTLAKLASVAEVLGMDPRPLWVHAGLMTATDAGLKPDARPARGADPDEVTREMIRNSAEFDEDAKRDLLQMLDEQAREDAARLNDQAREAAARRHSMFVRLVTAARTVKA